MSRLFLLITVLALFVVAAAACQTTGESDMPGSAIQPDWDVTPQPMGDREGEAQPAQAVTAQPMGGREGEAQPASGEGEAEPAGGEEEAQPMGGREGEAQPASGEGEAEPAADDPGGDAESAGDEG